MLGAELFAAKRKETMDWLGEFAAARMEGEDEEEDKTADVEQSGDGKKMMFLNLRLQ